MASKEGLLIDRVESYRAEKFRKAMVFLGILSVMMRTLKFIIGDEFNPTGFRLWISVTVAFAMLAYFIWIVYKEGKVKNVQFIEWTNDSIIFNLNNELTLQNPQTVLKSDIRDVLFTAQTLEIRTNKDETYVLNLSAFNHYKDRKRIRSNFQKLKEALAKN